MSTGTILNVKRFEIHDGPGMRTTLFLKGCPLRCKWCHNPESQIRPVQIGYYAHKCADCGICTQVCKHGAQQMEEGRHIFLRKNCVRCGDCTAECPKSALTLFGKEVTPREILPVLLEDKVFFDESNGGVTVSGGEPLSQPEFTAELLALLHENSVHTAVDTCLYAPREALEKVLPHTDIFLVDVKAIDDDVHTTCTGVPASPILENLRYIDSLGIPYEIRIPFIPTMNDGQIEKIAAFLSSLPHIGRVKLLAYHDLSRTKYSSLAMPYTMGDVKVPTAEEYDRAFAILKAAGLDAIHK